jgi:hypothetical protein
MAIANSNNAKGKIEKHLSLALRIYIGLQETQEI